MDQQRAVSCPPCWRDTVEHVDAALDRFKHVVNFANAQQVARLLVRQERQRPLENLVHIALRFAERPADAVRPEGQGRDKARTVLAQLAVGAALDDAEQRLIVPPELRIGVP